MANFMSIIYGKSGAEIHRLGHGSIETRANGWDFGIKVIGRLIKPIETNVFHIYKTGGSNGRNREELLLEILESGETRLSSYQCCECKEHLMVSELTPTMEWFSGNTIIPELICQPCKDSKNGKL